MPHRSGKIAHGDCHSDHRAQDTSNDVEGKDETVGNFDEERVQRLIDIDEPVFAAQKKPINDGPAPSDVVTNEFIDTKVGYCNSS